MPFQITGGPTYQRVLCREFGCKSLAFRSTGRCEAHQQRFKHWGQIATPPAPKTKQYRKAAADLIGSPMDRAGLTLMYRLMLGVKHWLGPPYTGWTKLRKTRHGAGQPAYRALMNAYRYREISVEAAMTELLAVSLAYYADPRNPDAASNPLPLRWHLAWSLRRLLGERWGSDKTSRIDTPTGSFHLGQSLTSNVLASLISLSKWWHATYTEGPKHDQTQTRRPRKGSAGTPQPHSCGA